MGEGMLEGWPGSWWGSWGWALEMSGGSHITQCLGMKLLCLSYFSSCVHDQAPSLFSPDFTPTYLVHGSLPQAVSCSHSLPQLSSTCVGRLKVCFSSFSPKDQSPISKPWSGPCLLQNSMSIPPQFLYPSLPYPCPSLMGQMGEDLEPWRTILPGLKSGPQPCASWENFQAIDWASLLVIGRW